MAKDYKIVKVNSLPIKFGKPLHLRTKDKYDTLKPIIHTRKSKGSDDLNTVQTQFELKEKEKDE